MDGIVLVGGIAFIINAVLLAAATVTWMWSLVDTARWRREHPDPPQSLSEIPPGHAHPPYSQEFIDLEQEKVDTASISVILLDHQEVPGTEGNDIMNNRSIAILPTGTNVNLVKSPSDNEYFETQATQYVVRSTSTGKDRVWQSFGTPGFYAIGDVLTAHHDQAGYSFGSFKLVGFVHDGVVEGEVPNRKLSLGVFK